MRDCRWCGWNYSDLDHVTCSQVSDFQNKPRKQTKNICWNSYIFFLLLSLFQKLWIRSLSALTKLWRCLDSLSMVFPKIGEGWNLIQKFIDKKLGVYESIFWQFHSFCNLQDIYCMGWFFCYDEAYTSIASLLKEIFSPMFWPLMTTDIFGQTDPSVTYLHHISSAKSLQTKPGP